MEFLPLLIILGAFLFFSSRRQRKAMQATIELHESLRVGDRIQTTSGLEAVIAGITDDCVDLEIAPGVVTRWTKLAVRGRIEPDDVTDGDAIAATDSGGAFEITDTTGTFGSSGTADGDISHPDRR